MQAGLTLLPVTVIMLLFSARSGRLAARIGPRLQMSVGPLVVAAGLAMLSRMAPSGSYFVVVLPGIVVFGAGLAITVAPLTSTAMGAAPSEHAGVASAVNNVVARTAGLLAVAILPFLAGITGDDYLHPAALAAGLPHGAPDRGGAPAWPAGCWPPSPSAIRLRRRRWSDPSACTAPAGRVSPPGRRFPSPRPARLGTP